MKTLLVVVTILTGLSRVLERGTGLAAAIEGPETPPGDAVDSQHRA